MSVEFYKSVLSNAPSMLYLMPSERITQELCLFAINKGADLRLSNLPEEIQSNSKALIEAYFNKNRQIYSVEKELLLTPELIYKYKLEYCSFNETRQFKYPEIVLALLENKYKLDVNALTESELTILIINKIPVNFWTEDFTNRILNLLRTYNTPKQFQHISNQITALCACYRINTNAINCFIRYFGIDNIFRPTEENMLLSLSEYCTDTHKLEAQIKLYKEKISTSKSTNLSETVCRAIILHKQFGRNTLRLLNDLQTPELVQLAVSRNPHSIEWVRPELRTPEMVSQAFEEIAKGNIFCM